MLATELLGIQAAVMSMWGKEHSKSFTKMIDRLKG